MNTSVNELLSNPAFRPLVLLDVLAVFLMIICLVFRRMRKGYYVEQANDARKATMLNIAVRNVTGMGVYSAPGYWANVAFDGLGTVLDVPVQSQYAQRAAGRERRVRPTVRAVLQPATPMRPDPCP